MWKALLLAPVLLLGSKEVRPTLRIVNETSVHTLVGDNTGTLARVGSFSTACVELRSPQGMQRLWWRRISERDRHYTAEDFTPMHEQGWQITLKPFDVQTAITLQPAEPCK